MTHRYKILAGGIMPHIPCVVPEWDIFQERVCSKQAPGQGGQIRVVLEDELLQVGVVDERMAANVAELVHSAQVKLFQSVEGLEWRPSYLAYGISGQGKPQELLELGQSIVGYLRQEVVRQIQRVQGSKPAKCELADGENLKQKKFPWERITILQSD